MKRWTPVIALFCIFALSAQSIYYMFEPGGDLGGTGSTWNNQVIANGAVTLAKQANLAANSIQCNTSSSAATPQACSPLGAVILQSAVLSVYAISTANITLSGVQTVDGVSVPAGNVVLLAHQTTTSQDGLWLVNSGSWTRPINFPSGYVISQNCSLLAIGTHGTTNQSKNYLLNTSVGAITIDTTAETWTLKNIPTATTTNYGLVSISADTATFAVALALNPFTNNDCAAWSGSGAPSAGNPVGIYDPGDIAGNTGGCALVDFNSGQLLLDGNGTNPTTNHGTMDGSSSNQGGIITSLSGATSVTVTYSATMPRLPRCSANDSAGTAVGISSSSTTAVTFTMSALTGTLYWNCL